MAFFQQSMLKCLSVYLPILRVPIVACYLTTRICLLKQIYVINLKTVKLPQWGRTARKLKNEKEYKGNIGVTIQRENEAPERKSLPCYGPVVLDLS